MATTLRLQRHGTRNAPFYHLVVANSRRSATKKFIEKLGYYDPSKEPSVLEFDAERVQYWYSKGATVSNTANVLFKLKKVKLERAKTAPAAKKAVAKKKK